MSVSGSKMWLVDPGGGEVTKYLGIPPPLGKKDSDGAANTW